MKKNKFEFIIDSEFQSQIPALTDEEFQQLEENILSEGEVLSPLIVWGNILVDGHNRYKILQQHPEIPYTTRSISCTCETREDVLAWICKHQLGRRNLTPEQKKFLIGKQYHSEKSTRGGNHGNQYTQVANYQIDQCFARYPDFLANVELEAKVIATLQKAEDYILHLKEQHHQHLLEATNRQ